MNEFNNLVMMLQSKGIEIQHCFEGNEKEKRYIKFFVNSSDVESWADLIERLNNVYNGIFRLNIDDSIQNNSGQLLATLSFEATTENFDKLEKDTMLIANAIENNEYIAPAMCHERNTFDLKLGISCNNNCIHCVIKPNVYSMQERYPEDIILDSGIGMQSTRDLTYAQVIQILSTQTGEFDQVVLTGGEPTIRKDFIQIIKWLYYNRPNGWVTIQTNGRSFCDKELVKQLRRYTRSLSFSLTVSFHGLEETNNKVVNNRKDCGNPFAETVQGLKNLLEVFPTGRIRTLMVMSSYNVNEVVDWVKFQYEEIGVKQISITYPDFPNFKKEFIEETAPSMYRVLVVMKELNDYVKDKKDLFIYFVDIPPCYFNQLEDDVRIKALGFLRKATVTNFLGDQNNEYDEYLSQRFSKTEKCGNCVLSRDCVGVYKETLHMREPFIRPIETITPAIYEFLKQNCWIVE